MIHSDVWGSFRVETIHGKIWFVSFIDDHTILTWVYLLKDKGELKHMFEDFYVMVETHFHVKIQIIRSDDGREVFNDQLGRFFTSKGIVHQISCPNTPQQSGVAERKKIGNLWK